MITPTPQPNDIWQLPDGRLADIVAVTRDGFVVDEAFTEAELTLTADDFTTSRLLYRDSVDGDPTFQPQPQPSSPHSPCPILVVGMRRFVRPPPQPWWSALGWRLTAMRRCPGVDRDNAPTAYRRLLSVGLDCSAANVYAVDLLPPGEGWDETAAVESARYLRGVADGMRAAIVLLGRQIAVAFAAVDSRVEDVRPLKFADGYLLLPSPHARDSEAYVEGGEYRDRIAAAVRQMVDSR